MSSRVDRLLIVPDAHVRVLNVPFQVEMYALFHRHWGSRIGHAVCTPVVMVALFGLLAPYRLELPTAALLLVLYLVFDRWVGLILIGPLAAAVFAGRALSHATTPAVLAMVMLGAAALQATSHAFEPIPPPWTPGFRSLSTFLRTASLRNIVGLSLLSVLYFFLELWATPRVWPLQVHGLLLRLGYRPTERAWIRARVLARIAEAEHGWPPRPS